MNKAYSQFQAMMAITKASLRSIFRSPSAVIFSIAFPMIFILVFGFIGSGGKLSVNIAFANGSDTANPIYQSLKNISGIKVSEKKGDRLKEDLEKGRITAILNIVAQPTNSAAPYSIQLTSSEAANPQNIQVLQSILNAVISGINQQQFPSTPTIATINKEVKKVPGRVYRTIDFILPGQLGFSLLSAGVFGVAFLFFNLRQQLVLKRFYATPIKRSYIVLGEALSRVIFQMITAVIIILVGHYAFHFTLVNGLVTFAEIMVLSFVALILFMGFGFIVSSVAKSESTIPPFANLITLPQFLLAGTFFSIDNFPTWLQPISRILPLTHFNNAMRNIAFEGASLLDCTLELGVLGIWIVVVYIVAFKTFKWE
ncbi:MAG: ABC transporter permease [Sphingobacteriia bacterium 24-36-13]|jgi:ABC-2 type transport system permease protein|uniref:ABC transporter permease n=1 Tax=Sediminibacterium sp. TaxID=1917865 RepID=UPI000BC95060|nr:ABC transporter permease [Sediminibacterium sp.]OYY10263.1 MAG: ABC transporter permease [Sphingobacteriia bacterium 35-36-14]OYZ54506.1 MAG: ABC transporter permease [Sphingobacteriia bacterium 24-36-13]OZA65473.1 MAG: ABC transporter permease [Sphingobacteriia bacterium 39-36-14]MBT9483319.1 ABC transporter permease [Sediminibacterium sp.]HQS23904.1 ABC transporter permease [Sediminibacterium sp.]